MTIPEKTINDLILQAYQLANVYAPDEYPTGGEMQNGIDYLNELLDNLSGNGSYIYSTNTISFNLTPNKGIYTLSKFSSADINTNKIVEIFDAYLTIDKIRHPLNIILHDEAYQQARYVESYTIPYAIFLQNKNEETELTFFNYPDKSYPVTLKAKQVIDHLNLGDEIHNIPPHYHRWIRYLLAKELCLIYETNSWNNEKQSDLDRMTSDAKGSTDTDWSIMSSNILLKRYKLYRPYSIMTG